MTKKFPFAGPVGRLGIWLALFLFLVGVSQVCANTLCFVNALPRVEKVDLLYQGKKIRPYPFGEGDITACLVVPPGNLAFTVQDPAGGSSPLAVKIDPGQHKTVVVYEKIIWDPKTLKEEKKISVLEAPRVGPPEDGKTQFRVAYVGGKDALALQIDGTTMTLTPDSVSELQKGGLSVKVKAGSSDAEPWNFTFEDSQSFVLVIFRSHDGKLRSSVAYESLGADSDAQNKKN